MCGDEATGLAGESRESVESEEMMEVECLQNRQNMAKENMRKGEFVTQDQYQIGLYQKTVLEISVLPARHLPSI